MKTIYKYSLKNADRQGVYLPNGAIILSVVNQNEDAVLYALVDSEKIEKERRNIFVHGTGHPIKNVPEYDLKFIGTLVFRDGLVFHFFESVLK